MENEKVFKMKLSLIYDCLVKKLERKQKSKQDLDTVIFWLTGYDEKTLKSQLEKDVDYKTFFDEAPYINPNSKFIKGSICGVKIENIENETLRNIRYLDKLVDELYKGKSMDKVLRKENINE